MDNLEGYIILIISYLISLAAFVFGVGTPTLEALIPAFIVTLIIGVPVAFIAGIFVNVGSFIKDELSK